MLTITRDGDDTFVLVSDDKNAENITLTEAIEVAAPQLLEAWEDTPAADDGLIRFRVIKADWEGLRDVLEELGSLDGINPEELAAIEDAVNLALDEA